MSKPCNRCGGSGQIFNEGLTSPWSDCSYCGGSGYTAKAVYPCARCAELEAKLEAIKKYTHHKLVCDRHSRPTEVSEFEVQRRPCSCGLGDLLKE